MRTLLAVSVFALVGFIGCGQADEGDAYGRARFDAGLDAGYNQGYRHGLEEGYNRGWVRGARQGNTDSCRVVNTQGDVFDFEGCAVFNCWRAGIEPFDCKWCVEARVSLDLEQALSSEPATWDYCGSP